MVTKLKPRTLTLDELISRFLNSRRSQNLSLKSIEYYQNIPGNFNWYAHSQGWPPPNEISLNHLRDFLDYVRTGKYRWPEAPRSSCKPASPVTVHRYAQAVKILFSWTEEEQYLNNNPASGLKLRSFYYKDVEPYTDEEARAMLEACEDEAKFGFRYLGICNRAIISLFIATDLRLSELAGVNNPPASWGGAS